MYLYVCNAWMIYKIGIIFKRCLINVWNFAVAYFRALVSLLYFFTSSFGFLLGLFIAFVFARFASWKFHFLVWVHLKRGTNYRRQDVS